MASACLVCDEKIPASNGMNVPVGKKKCIPILSDKVRALTSSQYTILQKVLSLRDGECKSELISGPYCHECFCNINNVCHCMSALENLQQSVIEFRKDFGEKIQKSAQSAGSVFSMEGSRKRKSDPSGKKSNNSASRTRMILLDCLRNSVFTSPISEPPTKPKHIHEIMSNIDPNTAPHTKVDKDQVLCTTNGTMPAKKKKSSKNYFSKKKTSAKKPQLNTLTSFRATDTEIGTGIETKLDQIIGMDEMDTNKVAAAATMFVCTFCHQQFNTKKQLRTHSMSHKSGKQFNLVYCPVCSQRYANNTSLRKHVMKYHPYHHSVTSPQPSSPSTATSTSASSSISIPRTRLSISSSKTFRPGRCKVCKKIVTNLQGHLKQFHSEINASEKDAPLSSTPPQEPNIDFKVDKEDKANTTIRESIAPSKEQEELMDTDTEATARNNDLARVTRRSKFEEKEKTASPCSLPSPKDLKTETTRITETKESPPTKPVRPPSFLVPAFATIPPPKPQASSSGSKYQFKNLLKIGEGDRN